MIDSIRIGGFARTALAAGAAPLVLLLVAACDLGFLGAASPVLGDVSIVLGPRGVLHRTAGVYYTVSNESPHDLVALDLALELYDGDERPLPASGRNSVRLSVVSDLRSGHVRSFCSSLDAAVPDGTSAIVVARFRVDRVTYADGTSRRVVSQPHPTVASR